MVRVCALCGQELSREEIGFVVGGLVAVMEDGSRIQVVLVFHRACVERFIGDLVTILIPKNLQ